MYVRTGELNDKHEVNNDKRDSLNRGASSNSIVNLEVDITRCEGLTNLDKLINEESLVTGGGG